MVSRVDRDLVQQAQRGDRDAFAVLVRTHGDRMFGVARRILRELDLADDAVQQALVIAWRELPRLREPDRFEAWLTRILVRICYEISRASRRASIHVVPLEARRGADRCGPAGLDRRSRSAGARLRRLPPDQRALLVLRHYLGLEPNEIAETLGIPAGTARSRLHYAHREMRAALEADARPAMAGGRSA